MMQGRGTPPPSGEKVAVSKTLSNLNCATAEHKYNAYALLARSSTTCEVDMAYMKSSLKARPMWARLLVILASLLALPIGAQAQADKPTNVALSSPTTSSLQLSWDAYSGATGYEYQRVLPRTGSVQSIADGSATSATISGLGSSTLYGYRFRAVTNDGKSDWASVPIRYTSPNPPRDLRTICVAGTVVQITWNQPDISDVDRESAVIRPFNYEIKTDNGNWESRAAGRARQISGLSLGTAYTFHVRAVLSTSDLDSFSSEVSLDVTTSAVHIEPPTNLQTSDITSASLTLTWTASATSSVTAYEVTTDGGATWVDSGSDTSHSFTGLNPDTNYRLSVRAKSGSDVSCPADPTTVRTLSTAPTGLNASGITQTAITLTWTAADGATSYKVRRDSGDWTTLGDVVTYEFTGLTADTEYTLEVVAINNNGESDTAEITARTLPNPPPPPAPVRATRNPAAARTRDRGV
ncbi:MAG: hypothetical protein F4W97_07450, partial [Chloroflexi bacterium]|nr:hypothetical protein [Chloroflexota bacterium]